MRVYNNAETWKQSGWNCIKHHQYDRKDVGKICFENRSNLKQYLYSRKFSTKMTYLTKKIQYEGISVEYESKSEKFKRCIDRLKIK